MRIHAHTLAAMLSGVGPNEISQSSLQVIIHGSSVPTRSLSRALLFCCEPVPSTCSRPGRLAKDAVSLWILSTVVACMCSPTFSPAPPLHHLLSLLKTNLDPPKPCGCFWKLSTCITFPGRSALLRLFLSHTPPASSDGSQTCIWSCHPGFDCLLRLRHSALLGDRRQRFFFADLGSAQGPVRFLPVCLRKRLYGYTFLSAVDPVNRWTQAVVVSTLKIATLTALLTSNLIISVCGALEPVAVYYKQRHPYHSFSSCVTNLCFLSAPIFPLLQYECTARGAAAWRRSTSYPTPTASKPCLDRRAMGHLCRHRRHRGPLFHARKRQQTTAAPVARR